ncbi:hypothetical protein Tsubulata_006425 [Turnera subulata]|uniref:Uncharacterized protein n=1 Tax=Turnera subulata TaxID=218843 RepID=A0A9Q0G0V2_9ROSI|nr:hypothetical protein Tsubulata_006425 [Turnera subulata]
MGNTEKLLNQIMDLKFTSKSLQRQARKCEKEEKSEKLKVKKVNYLRLSSRLDAVVARLDTQAKMTTINKSMANIVKSLESSLATEKLKWLLEVRGMGIRGDPWVSRGAGTGTNFPPRAGSGAGRGEICGARGGAGITLPANSPPRCHP